MEINFESLLQEMGWDKAYCLPTANAVNSQLEKEVRAKTEEYEKIRIEVENYKNRTHNMKDNLKNVKTELTQVQQLIKARQKEMEAEDHMFQLAYREDEWLFQDMEKLKKSGVDLEEKCQRLGATVTKQQTKLNEINEVLRFDEKSLFAWLDELSKHDDDVMALQRYSKQDEEKMKELVIKVRALTVALAQEKQTLCNLITEYRCCQMEMNKTAEEYTQLHEERHQLIKQWEASIKQMQNRDREINSTLNDMTKTKAELEAKKLMEDAKKTFLKQLKNNNQEVETAMIFADKNLTKLRDQYKYMKTQYNLYSDDLRTATSQVATCAADLESEKEKLKHWRAVMRKTKENYENELDRIEELQKSLETVKGDLLSSEEKAALSYKHVHNMESRRKCLEFELNRMMEIKYRKGQELERAKANEKTLMNEIQGSKTATQNLKKRIFSLEKMAQRQEEVIYGQDVVVQQLEDRISRITGNTKADEKKMLENKIAKLEETFNKKDTSCTFLNQQIKLLEEDTIRVKRELVKQNGVREDYTIKMKDLTMEIDAANAELKALTNKKQNYLVEENLLKLQVKKLKDQLLSKADDVLNLEKQKLELEQVMKEHYRDINTQKEMLRTQFNSIEEEKHFLLSELNNHKTHINNLKNRYEILVSNMSACVGVPEDDVTCHVKYFIHAVQEKQKLQLEGDELDAQVLKAEKEVIALENTLKLMNSSNDNLRKSFNPVTKSSEEHEEKLQLEEQVRLSRERLVIKKKHRNEILNESEQLQQQSETFQNNYDRLAYNNREQKDHMANLGRRLSEQYSKLDRATNMNAKYKKSVRSKGDPKTKLLLEYDIDLRILRDANKFLIKNLETFLSNKESVVDEANIRLREAQLPLLKTDEFPARDESSITTYSQLSFCTSHGSFDTTPLQESKSSVINIAFADEIPRTTSSIPKKECSLIRASPSTSRSPRIASGSVSLSTIEITAPSTTHLGYVPCKCKSEIQQAPVISQKVRLARKAPTGSVTEDEKLSKCSLQGSKSSEK